MLISRLTVWILCHNRWHIDKIPMICKWTLPHPHPPHIRTHKYTNPTTHTSPPHPLTHPTWLTYVHGRQAVTLPPPSTSSQCGHLCQLSLGAPDWDSQWKIHCPGGQICRERREGKGKGWGDGRGKKNRMGGRKGEELKREGREGRRRGRGKRSWRGGGEGGKEEKREERRRKGYRHCTTLHPLFFVLLICGLTKIPGATKFTIMQYIN